MHPRVKSRSRGRTIDDSTIAHHWPLAGYLLRSNSMEKQSRQDNVPGPRKMFNTPRPFLLLSHVPILCHCDAFMTTFSGRVSCVTLHIFSRLHEQRSSLRLRR
ncbi:hypothetical protein EVAR_66480_1 [Eumeta japonica]|uniref:Uncharacterized protein n=1 Tax=Eumeta variegata TaxID=151549 RepID=A0A4C2A1S5_EUMVA|nr:hypothetical protein EVAR_66480_1 [Eumeta japonica]